MKTKTLAIIASIVGGVFVVLVGSYLIYCINEAKKTEPLVTTTSETSLSNVITTSSEITITESIAVTEPTDISEPTETTLSAEELQSQIDENNRRLESLQSESESLRLESESVEASISESIRESEIQASIDESISESITESQRQEATRTTKETTKQTEPPSETKEPTSKPKGNPKLSKSTITITAGDTDSFVAQASEIYVMNTNVSASLDFSGVSFNTPGTYTAYFNAFDGSYSLPLTVIVA